MMGSQRNNNQITTSFIEESIDFRKIIEQLYRHVWFIVSVSVVTFSFAFLHSLGMIPQYQTNALIQVNSQSSNDILTKLAMKQNASSSVDSLLALIRTRYILEPVIKSNGLNIEVIPHYFPIFGSWKARKYERNDLAKPFLWFNSYAWGGEKIKVKEFSVPDQYEGQTFKLVAGKKNTYQLVSEQGAILLQGKLGEYSSSNGISLYLSEFKARPGTQFFLKSKVPLYMADELANNLRIEYVPGIDPGQNSNVLRLTLTGSDPDKIVKTLNEIVNYTVDQSAHQKAREAEKTLYFLKQRLPELKLSLEQAEGALISYRVNEGGLTVTSIGQMIIHKLMSTDQSLEKLKKQEKDLLEIYTPLHPYVIAVKNQEQDLQNQLIKIKNQIKKYPSKNQKELNLEREAKIKNIMYFSMLNDIQHLELIKVGILSDIRALDDATPASQLPSRKNYIRLMGLLAGIFLSSMLIIVKNFLNKTVENADQLEEELQIPVRAIIPFSRNQKQMERAQQKGLKTFGSAFATPLILAKQEPDDIAIESLRSLQVNLRILNSSKHNIIAFMGSVTNIGKSFVSLNFAQVIATAGKRTLLIDADIRKGKLHKSLNQQKSHGLSEYLEGKTNYDSIIHPVDENLFFISSGQFTLQPTELFQKQHFSDLLNRAKNDFDQIIVDSAPLLSVSDSILIARHCDIKLFVVDASSDSMSDVKQAVKKARGHEIEINGIVLNHRKSLMPYGSHSYSRYAYTPDTA